MRDLFLNVSTRWQRQHAAKSEVMEDYMKYDCGFSKENYWFRYRACGFLIHNDKMLFVKSNFGDYYYMIGGGVHLGETSDKCVEREVFEESGIKSCVDHLAVVCENFFNGSGGSVEGLLCHEIEFYYFMKILDNDLSICKHKTDAGEELVWLPVEKIKTSNIKPAFIKYNIDKIINEKHIVHIMEKDDTNK